jgi:hypothetical protein
VSSQRSPIRCRPTRTGGIPALDHVARPAPADASYVDDLRQASHRLVALDTRHGGNDVLALATRTFQAAHFRLASGAYLPEVERDLQAAVGEAGEVAAWVAYDADKQPLSRALCQEAMLVSRLAGDRSMELMLAQLGDRPRSLAAIGRARSMLADGITNRDPPWMWWIGGAELACHDGMANADLGDWRAAVPLFRESSAGRGQLLRSGYNDTAHLLDALVHAEAWHDAEPVAEGLASFSAEVGSARTASLLRRVTRSIRNTDTTPALADSADELTRLLDIGALA